MIRKTAHIALSLLLLISTAGISMTRHYCSDILISVSVYSEAEPCCDGENGCCNNETEIYQIQDDFAAGEYQNIEQIRDFSILYTLSLVQFYFEPVSDSYTDYHIPEPPPPPSQREFLSQIQTYLC